MLIAVPALIDSTSQPVHLCAQEQAILGQTHHLSVTGVSLVRLHSPDKLKVIYSFKGMCAIVRCNS